MPLITLRLLAGTSSDGDLSVEVKDNTFEYLRTSPAPTIRVSAYLDRDWPQVERAYAELHVADDCAFETRITRLTPGSRTRQNIQLPGPMYQGEQLVLEVARRGRSE